MQGELTSAVFGRDAERRRVAAFLDGELATTALVLTGDPGAGKTTIWECGLTEAAVRGQRVLSTRASGAEAQLAYVALGDLLEDVEQGVLDALPAPQRTALAVALLRAEPDGDPPSERAVAVALLEVLRALGERGSVLVAIDDAQWLDPTSADVLAFAARRLRPADRVRFLLTERPGDHRLPAGEHPERLAVGPLTEASLRAMLVERLGLTLPRRVMADVMEASDGNALLTLEIGRSLAVRGLPAVGEPLPASPVVEELLGARLAALAPDVRALVLAVALSPGLRRAELARLAPEAVQDAAFDAGVLATDGERVRLTQPMLAAVVRGQAGAADHRSAHLALAEAATGDELRALHLALAADEPEAGLAADVAGAADRAGARGAALDAIALAEHALRLTPADAPERPDRVMALAEHLQRGSQDRRLTELLTAELPRLPAGARRVRARLLLTDAALEDSVPRHVVNLEAAEAEAGGDPVLLAPVLAERVTLHLLAAAERVPDGERWAEQALAAAPRAGVAVEREVLHAAAWARVAAGRPIDDLVARFDALEGGPPHIFRSVGRVEAVRHGWRGELQEARALCERLAAAADERGDAWSYVAMQLHLCEVELRAGEWERVERILREWTAYSDGPELMVVPAYERCRALLAAGRGDPHETERWIGAALAASDDTGVGWDRLEVWRARGTAALLARDPNHAVEWLRAVWDHTLAEGFRDPGTFPVAPDLVEALVELGDVDEAAGIVAVLEEAAAEQDHPWARLTARRGRGLLELAAGADAGEDLAAAAADLEAAGLRFDAARALLALGRGARRGRRWGASREALTDAASAFDAMGSPGWAELARAELGRVAARRPPADPTQLTESERRVAELAAEGRSNKEIAQALVVSVSTVESHLTRAYAKLGVRSRAQLAARFGD